MDWMTRLTDFSWCAAADQQIDAIISLIVATTGVPLFVVCTAGMMLCAFSLSVAVYASVKITKLGGRTARFLFDHLVTWPLYAMTERRAKRVGLDRLGLLTQITANATAAAEAEEKRQNQHCLGSIMQYKLPELKSVREDLNNAVESQAMQNMRAAQDAAFLKGVNDSLVKLPDLPPTPPIRTEAIMAFIDAYSPEAAWSFTKEAYIRLAIPQDDPSAWVPKIDLLGYQTGCSETVDSVPSVPDFGDFTYRELMVMAEEVGRRAKERDRLAQEERDRLRDRKRREVMDSLASKAALAAARQAAESVDEPSKIPQAVKDALVEEMLRGQSNETTREFRRNLATCGKTPPPGLLAYAPDDRFAVADEPGNGEEPIGPPGEDDGSYRVDVEFDLPTREEYQQLVNRLVAIERFAGPPVAIRPGSSAS